jgi:hypothetical protein
MYVTRCKPISGSKEHLFLLFVACNVYFIGVKYTLLVSDAKGRA